MKTRVAAVCATGLCNEVRASEAQSSDDASPTCDPKEFASIRDRADAARLRFSKLVEILETRLPETQPNRRFMFSAPGAQTPIRLP